ncbi:cellulose-binding domain-containing protein [Dactylosporangium sp. NPDC000244]|uniref:cellulose-binding domain-containing protein n=1 Tax=Dactylosporangium sp. NPDC000244 TaxID=3154365 RepID=UPI00332A37D2
MAVAATVGLAAAGTAVATTMASAATAGCRVSYTISSQWQGGFGASVAITNLGDQINGWTLTWSFTNGQTITQAWNATVTQSGASVSATNVSYNGALATGASTSFGFNGAWNGTNAVPTAFRLNNVACTGTVEPTTSASPSRSASPSPSGSRSPSPTPSSTRSASPTPTSTGSTGPALKTVRVFWLKPTDVAFDQRYPDGIASVMREAQRYYKQELGKTFTLNTTVVEVVNGEHNAQWYITTNCNTSDHYWCVVENMQAELTRRFGISNQDSRWLCVGEISAEEAGKSGGGGGPGWVILSGHDADGAAGINGPMNRWYGGMVHELGHGFGLPDASSTDGTPMSASFYNYPNTHFSQAQKNAILAGPYGSFLT